MHVFTNYRNVCMRSKIQNTNQRQKISKMSLSNLIPLYRIRLKICYVLVLGCHAIEEHFCTFLWDLLEFGGYADMVLLMILLYDFFRKSALMYCF